MVSLHPEELPQGRCGVGRALTLGLGTVPVLRLSFPESLPEGTCPPGLEARLVIRIEEGTYGTCEVCGNVCRAVLVDAYVVLARVARKAEQLPGIARQLHQHVDEVLLGGDSQLPDDIGGVPTGGTFSPLAKGRVYGAEVTFNL